MADDVSKATQKPVTVNTRFKQQKLWFIENRVFAGTYAPVAFVISMVLTPMGLGLLFFTHAAQDIIIDYTNCYQEGNVTEDKILQKCADIINPTDSHKTCQCQLLEFEVKESIKGKVFMYYGLSNFHQNHRRYLESRDLNQLKGVGTVEDPLKPSKKCEPYDYADKVTKQKMYFPCGSVANSFFSDEIHLLTKDTMEIPVLRKGIAWQSDKQYSFKNPSWFKEAAKDPNHKAWTIFVKPPNWRKHLYELDPTNPENNGLQNEDFIVWMRTAAFTNFRKLYRIVDHEHDCSQQKNPSPLCTDKKFMKNLRNGLPKGKYWLKILYSFPVKPFHGTKSVIISSNSLVGEENFFLAYVHIVVGIVCFICGCILLIIHYQYGNRNLLHTTTTRGQQVEFEFDMNKSTEETKEKQGSERSLIEPEGGDITLNTKFGLQQKTSN